MTSNPSEKDRVLIITYYWPPGSGAGVQRWLKFARYLPEFGWKPVILTVDPAIATYPASDSTLENDIPAGLEVYKTSAKDYFRIYKRDRQDLPSAGFASGNNRGIKSTILRFIRGNFFIPDPRRGWNSYAFNEACQLIEKYGIEKVITTSPPHSTQLIGLKLKRNFPHLKWIADLRDPWTDIYYYKNFYPSAPARWLDKRYERKVLSEADGIITVGNSLKVLFKAKTDNRENKIKVITNGYDEADFTNITKQTPGRFTVSYIGTLSEQYPVEGFLDAAEKLFAVKGDIFIRFAGAFAERQKRVISSRLKKIPHEILPYVDHATAIRLMNESSVLLLIIPDHQSNRSIITGKLFEYLASRKPILCIGPPDGDAAGILKESSSGKCFGYDDSEGIKSFLEEKYNNPDGSASDISVYSRKYLTGKLAEYLKK